MGKKRGGNKGRRTGGARQMIYDAEGLAQRNAQQAEKQKQTKARRKAKGCDSSSSDYSDDEEGPDFDAMNAMSIQDDDEAGRKEKKAGGVAGLLGDGWGDGNLNSKKKQNLKVSQLDGTQKVELSRREREALEKQARERNYAKRHAAGETEEAKKHLERLKIIRARREAQAARASQNNEVKEKEKEKKEKKRKKGKKESSDSEEEIQKLTSREIKKMNPTKMKEELKLRGLSTQGNKKVLQERLIKAQA